MARYAIVSRSTIQELYWTGGTTPQWSPHPDAAHHYATKQTARQAQRNLIAKYDIDKGNYWNCLHAELKREEA